MKKYSTILCLIIFLSSSYLSYSQYLVVSKEATIKEQPKVGSVIIEKVVRGDTLPLLQDGQQTNGYYHVKCVSCSQTGWIYRTLVRRYEEALPGCQPDEQTAVVNSSVSVGQIPAGYYTGTENLDGQALKRKLYEIIKNQVEFEYTSDDTTDVWDILKDTDRDPADCDHVICIYSGISMDAASEKNTWQREHVWSQSHGQFGRKEGPGVDVHHLRPVHPKFNGSNAKSNKDFDEGGKAFKYDGREYGCYVTDSTWEPRDEVKGDIARMMFYMAVRYEGENGEPDLELINNSNTSKNYKNQPVYGNLSTLLKWNEADPVDKWERNRNDIIYNKYQKNRNPFIDHPEFVKKIWPN
jgi:endonuclease I